VIKPYFAPGSGCHQAGQCSPGSIVNCGEMHKAAFPCTVVVLYRRGARIPAAELLKQEPPAGFLVCLDQYTYPNWYACLFRDKEMNVELLPRLLHVQLERENGGVRLYGGIVVEEREECRQAWLCTPTPERAREILLHMLEQQSGHA
jgi:hypothetical protein